MGNRSLRVFPILAALALLPGAARADAAAEAAVSHALDAFHAAAARADEEAYFALFAPEGVFLGTDASERWSVQEFRSFVHPYFARGAGWTYTPRQRHVELSPDGALAWFDERLDNDKYGECRGTGVLRKISGSWRIAQYNLTIPIPNDLAADVVERIRRGAAAKE